MASLWLRVCGESFFMGRVTGCFVGFHRNCTGGHSWSLTWVGLTLIWMYHPSCPAALPILPFSHQPKQGQADSGIAKIKVNPTQVRDLLCHPVGLYHKRELNMKDGMSAVAAQPFRHVYVLSVRALSSSLMVIRV